MARRTDGGRLADAYLELRRSGERISTHPATLDLVGSLRTSLFARALRLPRDRVAELRSSELLGRITVDSDAVENLSGLAAKRSRAASAGASASRRGCSGARPCCCSTSRPRGLDTPIAGRLLAGARAFDPTAALVIALHHRQSPVLPWIPTARIELARHGASPEGGR